VAGRRRCWTRFSTAIRYTRCGRRWPPTPRRPACRRAASGISSSPCTNWPLTPCVTAPGTDGCASGKAAGAAGGTEKQSRDAALWRTDSGHGLWLVRHLADQLSLNSGPHGTTATFSFTFGPAGPGPPLHLSRHSHNGCTVLVITGQLDLRSADQLVDAVDETFAISPPPPLVLDLAGLTSWDSSAVATLLTAQRRISAHPISQMILAGLPGPLLQRLHDTGLASRFTIADTTDHAIRDAERRSEG
jgi:anti-anti-sigma factor